MKLYLIQFNCFKSIPSDLVYISEIISFYYSGILIFICINSDLLILQVINIVLV